MKILLIGIGNMGKNHKRVLQELQKEYEFELKTVDTNGKEDCPNYKIAIERFKPTHVMICTPTETHGEILDYCDGKVAEIFVEKPIVSDNSEGSYNTTRSKIMVGHIERYNPMVNKMKAFLTDREFNTIVCLRCGLPGGPEDYEVDKDLCVHDTDVVQYLSRHLKHKIAATQSGGNPLFNKVILSNIADVFTEINGVTCFFHADKTSPHKIRQITVLGPNFILEGDYIEQTVKLNNEILDVKKEEPLKVEIKYFLDGKYTKEDLREAINNLKILKGTRLGFHQ